MENQPNKKQINIKAKDEVLQGHYCNSMQVLHSKEEFVLDFINMFPPHGTLNSRIITSPGHVKRIIKALQENVDKYEQKFGAIAEIEPPKLEEPKDGIGSWEVKS